MPPRRCSVSGGVVNEDVGRSDRVLVTSGIVYTHSEPMRPVGHGMRINRMVAYRWSSTVYWIPNRLVRSACQRV